jgi:Flp pilus assembly protein TadG
MKKLAHKQRSSSRSLRNVDDRRGALVVEFAVIAPIIFLFIFAFFEFGRMLMVQHALSDAARDACRQASLATMTSSNDVIEIAKARLESVIPNADSVTTVTVSPTWSAIGEVTGGTSISVTIQVDHDRVSWLPAAQLLNKDGVLTAEANQERE